MKERVEIIYEKISKTTRTLVWQGNTLLENKVMEEMLHDTAENRALILKKYHDNACKNTK